MNPISLFGFGHYVFCFFNIIFDQLKMPAADGKQYSLRKMLAQTSAEISPPKAKILAMSLPPTE